MDGVGELLKKTREEKKISIEEIIQKTNLKTDYIVALENEDYGKLPTFIHAKGFMRTYANCLGLDGKELAQRMVSAEQTFRDKQDKKPVNIDGNYRYKATWKDVKDGLLEAFRSNQAALIKVAVVLSIVLFAFAVFKTGQALISNVSQALKSETKEDRSSDQIDPVAQTEAAAPGPVEPSPVDVPLKETPTMEAQSQASDIAGLSFAEKELSLDLSATENVWISVHSDEQLIYEGALSQGSQENWKAKDTMSIKISDARKVLISVNGHHLGRLGAEEQVIRKLLITKNGIELS